ncbi:unnamed protein product, partial [Amoebophrya sp. A120]|eukprot:GSA120T00021072001.1
MTMGRAPPWLGGELQNCGGGSICLGARPSGALRCLGILVRRAGFLVISNLSFHQPITGVSGGLIPISITERVERTGQLLGGQKVVVDQSDSGSAAGSGSSTTPSTVVPKDVHVAQEGTGNLGSTAAAAPESAREDLVRALAPADGRQRDGGELGEDHDPGRHDENPATRSYPQDAGGKKTATDFLADPLENDPSETTVDGASSAAEKEQLHQKKNTQSSIADTEGTVGTPGLKKRLAERTVVVVSPSSRMKTDAEKDEETAQEKHDEDPAPRRADAAPATGSDGRETVGRALVPAHPIKTGSLLETRANIFPPTLLSSTSGLLDGAIQAAKDTATQTVIQKFQDHIELYFSDKGTDMTSAVKTVMARVMKMGLLDLVQGNSVVLMVDTMVEELGAVFGILLKGFFAALFPPFGTFAGLLFSGPFLLLLDRGMKQYARSTESRIYELLRDNLSIVINEWATPQGPIFEALVYYLSNESDIFQKVADKLNSVLLAGSTDAEKSGANAFISRIKEKLSSFATNEKVTALIRALSSMKEGDASFEAVAEQIANEDKEFEAAGIPIEGSAENEENAEPDQVEDEKKIIYEKGDKSPIGRLMDTAQTKIKGAFIRVGALVLPKYYESPGKYLFPNILSLLCDVVGMVVSTVVGVIAGPLGFLVKPIVNKVISDRIVAVFENQPSNGRCVEKNKSTFVPPPRSSYFPKRKPISQEGEPSDTATTQDDALFCCLKPLEDGQMNEKMEGLIMRLVPQCSGPPKTGTLGELQCEEGEIPGLVTSNKRANGAQSSDKNAKCIATDDDYADVLCKNYCKEWHEQVPNSEKRTDPPAKAESDDGTSLAHEFCFCSPEKADRYYVKATLAARTSACAERRAAKEENENKCFTSKYMFCMPANRPCMNFPLMLNQRMSHATMTQIPRLVSGFTGHAMARTLRSLKNGLSFLLSWGAKKFQGGVEAVKRLFKGPEKGQEQAAKPTKGSRFLSLESLTTKMRQILATVTGDKTVAAVKTKVLAVIGGLVSSIPVVGPFIRRKVEQELDSKIEGALESIHFGRRANDFVLAKIVPRMVSLVLNEKVLKILKSIMGNGIRAGIKLAGSGFKRLGEYMRFWDLAESAPPDQDTVSDEKVESNIEKLERGTLKLQTSDGDPAEKIKNISDEVMNEDEGLFEAEHDSTASDDKNTGAEDDDKQNGMMLRSLLDSVRSALKTCSDPASEHNGSGRVNDEAEPKKEIPGLSIPLTPSYAMRTICSILLKKFSTDEDAKQAAAFLQNPLEHFSPPTLPQIDLEYPASGGLSSIQPHQGDSGAGPTSPEHALPNGVDETENYPFPATKLADGENMTPSQSQARERDDFTLSALQLEMNPAATIGNFVGEKMSGVLVPAIANAVAGGIANAIAREVVTMLQEVLVPLLEESLSTVLGLVAAEAIGTTPISLGTPIAMFAGLGVKVYVSHVLEKKPIWLRKLQWSVAPVMQKFVECSVAISVKQALGDGNKANEDEATDEACKPDKRNDESAEDNAVLFGELSAAISSLGLTSSDEGTAEVEEGFATVLKEYLSWRKPFPGLLQFTRVGEEMTAKQDAAEASDGEEKFRLLAVENGKDKLQVLGLHVKGSQLLENDELFKRFG